MFLAESKLMKAESSSLLAVLPETSGEADRRDLSDQGRGEPFANLELE
jgi:hypothetical protein